MRSGKPRAASFVQYPDTGKGWHMATYDVEVFRVVRLAFVNIEAESAESAALVADAKARDLTDCILVTKSPADAGAIEVLPAGTLRKVTDGY
eukprot:gene49351-66131_t